MSDVIDLTNNDSDRKVEHNSSGGPPKQRRLTEARPNTVFVVIHDKEPPERYLRIARKMDTEIIGIYYSYADACEAARDYVMDRWEEEEDDRWKEEDLENIEWSGEGWLYQEYSMVSDCDQRVHVKQHGVS